MAKILEVRADNVDNLGGFGANNPITTTWKNLANPGTNDGTLNNWPTTASRTHGWNNLGNSVCNLNYLTFDGDTDGTGDYVDFGNLGSLPANGSMEIWFNQSIFDPAASHRNLASTNRVDATNNAIRFEQVNSPANELDCVVGNGSTTTDNVFGVATNALNTDIQIVVTWDTGLNKLIGYLNGVQVFNNSVTAWPSTMPDVCLGAGFSTARCWQGYIRIFRIYNSTLTPAQVMTNYIADAHPQIQATANGALQTYTLPVVNNDTWTTTQQDWFNIGGSTFQYVPNQSDAGIIQAPFVSGNGYGTLNIITITFRDYTKLVRWAANPILGSGQSSPWVHSDQKVGDSYFVLVQNTNQTSIALYNTTDMENYTLSGSSPAISPVGGTWIDHFLVHPNIVKDGSTWRCFIEGKTSGGSPAIGMFTSTDGVTWTAYVSNPVISAFETPGAIKVGSTIYLLAGTNATTPVNLFTSTDGGQTWTNQGAVIPAPVGGDWDFGATAIIDFFPFASPNGGYEMLYTAEKSGGWTVASELQQLGAYLTLDFYVWFKFQGAIWKKGTASWEDGYPGDPSQMIIGNALYFTWSGTDHNNVNGGAGLATMTINPETANSAGNPAFGAPLSTAMPSGSRAGGPTKATSGGWC